MTAARVARTWRGRTRAEDAGAYLAFLDRTGVADCRATPGNRGVIVLHDTQAGWTEFLFISLWDDERSIAAFAGADPLRARFYPEDEQFLVERDETVTHYRIGRNLP